MNLLQKLCIVMGVNNIRKEQTMKNNLYLTEADSANFSEWFGRAYTLVHPEVELNERLCQNVTLVVTEDCNFDCTYCYMHEKNQKKMTAETARDIVDFLLDEEKTNGYISAKTSPGIVLDFIGGEPLLAIEEIEAFMAYFVFRTVELDHPWKDNYVISMSSNGALYNTPEVQAFINRYRGRVHIGITIDGTKELHDTCRIYKGGKGTYDDVLDGVKQRFMNGEHPSTKVTLAPENLQYLSEATLHLFNLGYKFLYCNVVFEDVWEQQHAAMLYQEMKKLADIIIQEELYTNNLTSLFSESIGSPMDQEDNDNWCGGDGSMLAIGTDGKCYPCLRYMSYAFANRERPALEIGDIYSGIVDEDKSDHIKCLKCITRRSQSTDECFNCPVAKGCGWCSAFNYDCFGTADKRTTYHCEMHKARVLANVYFWNSLYKKLELEKRFELHVPDYWALAILDNDELAMLKELSK